MKLYIRSLVFILYGMYTAGALSAPLLNDCALLARKALLRSDKTVDSTLFVPFDSVKKILIGLIESEKTKIQGAFFRVSDSDIVEALNNARLRGVLVEIVTDKGCLNEKYEKVSAIKGKNASIFVYDKSGSIMHNKFFIFHQNAVNNGARAIVWHGSANASTVGFSRNHESVMVRDNPATAAAFSDYFKRLKQETTLLKVHPVRPIIHQMRLYTHLFR